MKSTMKRGDFWELRARIHEANTEVGRLRAKATAVEQQRDDLLRRFGRRYGFTWDRPVMLDDADLSVSQEEASGDQDR